MVSKARIFLWLCRCFCFLSVVELPVDVSFVCFVGVFACSLAGFLAHLKTTNEYKKGSRDLLRRCLLFIP